MCLLVDDVGISETCSYDDNYDALLASSLKDVMDIKHCIEFYFGVDNHVTL